MSDLFASVLMYRWSLVAAVVVAPALAMLGAQLATRDRALESVCVSQGAMLGVLIGLGLLNPEENLLLHSTGPMLFGLGGSVATLLFCRLFYRVTNASPNTLFAMLFTILLSLQHLISVVFPTLEHHLAQCFFGDLATLSQTDAMIACVLGLLFLGIFWGAFRTWSQLSIEHALYGRTQTSSERKWDFAFEFLSLVLICLSVQYIGLLFTLGMLFIPTAILSFSSIPGLFRHLFLVALISSFSAASGFLISLHFTRIPTVPGIILLLVGSSLAALMLSGTWIRKALSR